MNAIALQNLTKRFGEVAAVDGVSLEIGAGEFFALLGPSGCGKTTLLRLLAGFEQADAGEIRIDGRDLTHAPPQQRPVNTVFQSYALFPHLSVFENVAFSLRVRKTTPPEIERRVGEALEKLHLGELRARLPSEISGGQRQRAALARALVARPKVLLLDEPLAAVDAQRRAQVQQDLKALQRQTGTTFLHVTHDQDEALSLSDRLAVMNAGRIAQIGAPRDIYERPRTRMVASFVGRCNIIEGQAVSAHTVQTKFGNLQTTEAAPRMGACALGIRAERVRLQAGAGEPNHFRARVLSSSYTGAMTEHTLALGSETVRAAQTGANTANEGEEITVSLPPEALFFLEEA